VSKQSGPYYSKGGKVVDYIMYGTRLLEYVNAGIVGRRNSTLLFSLVDEIIDIAFYKSYEIPQSYFWSGEKSL
jgi:hypothetical protein